VSQRNVFRFRLGSWGTWVTIGPQGIGHDDPALISAEMRGSGSHESR
jgi:hypothetical protein